MYTINKKEYILGAALLALTLIIGITTLATPMLLARLIIGLIIGYSLARSFSGFAGVITRPYMTGSTKLMRAFMFLIVMASFITLLFAAIPSSDVNADFLVNYNLFIHPVTLGTVIGSFIFGMGMSLVGGCASGVLTDMTIEFPKALIGLFFFGLGFVISMPFGSKFPALINESIISSSDGRNGVFFPDLFKFDGLNGYLGAFILTVILAAIVIKLSYMYERKRKAENTYTPIETEEVADGALVSLTDESQSFYYRYFARPWTLIEGFLGMLLAYVALMGFTKGAWGVSGAFGFWFAKLLNTLGVSSEAIANYTGNPNLLNPTVWTHPMSVQDIGIIIGAFVALLSMGILFNHFKKGLKISAKQVILAIIGGLLMGLSIGISKGCNAGGLFSPIVSFSLSGWIFLVFMCVGAVFGNKIVKAIFKS